MWLTQPALTLRPEHDVRSGKKTPGGAGTHGTHGPGRTAPPPDATRLLLALSFRRPLSSRRGEALSEREAAGSGSLGAASSESAAGIVRLLRPGLAAAVD